MCRVDGGVVGHRYDHLFLVFWPSLLCQSLYGGKGDVKLEGYPACSFTVAKWNWAS